MNAHRDRETSRRRFNERSKGPRKIGGGLGTKDDNPNEEGTNSLAPAEAALDGIAPCLQVRRPSPIWKDVNEWNI